MLAALWIVPLIARSAAAATLLPLAVPAMLAAFALLLRRAIAESGAATPWRFAIPPPNITGQEPGNGRRL